MTPAPKALLARFRAGDDQAGAALGRALLPAVRALALAGTLETGLAAEVTQKSLETLFSRIGEAPEDGRLLPLVETITRAEVRARGARPGEIVGIPGELAARARGPAVDLEAVFGELPPDRAARMLIEAAAWIPDQYQAVFLLRYVEGLTYPEIAELTGTSAKEVGTALAAARRLYEREISFRLKKLANP